MSDNQVDCIFDGFVAELERADAKYGHMPGMKDGLHTLKIELAELEREVETEMFDPEALRKEAIQVGAMATKFMRDVVKPALRKHQILQQQGGSNEVSGMCRRDGSEWVCGKRAHNI